MADISNSQTMRVVADPKDFDGFSGTLLERLIFNHRLLLIIVFAILTGFFGFQLKSLEITASFDKMLPQKHPYIQNYLENRDQLRGLGDSVRVVVEAKQGDIFHSEYLATLAKIND